MKNKANKYSQEFYGATVLIWEDWNTVPLDELSSDTRYLSEEVKQDIIFLANESIPHVGELAVHFEDQEGQDGSTLIIGDYELPFYSARLKCSDIDTDSYDDSDYDTEAQFEGGYEDIEDLLYNFLDELSTTMGLNYSIFSAYFQSLDDVFADALDEGGYDDD